MTDEQKAYLQALSDVRSWHRRELAQCLGDVRAMQTHKKAVDWFDMLIATKKRHAAEDQAERQRARAANLQSGDLRPDPASSGSRRSSRADT